MDGMMLYAQILNGVVQNIIVLDDASLIPTFSTGFDYLVRIDNLDLQPNIGSLYDGKDFTN